MQITRVGVDIAKSVFHVHAVDRYGEKQWQSRLSRESWIDALVERVPAGCEIGMEACGSAHHWARLLGRRGFKVKLIAAQFVKPYVKSNKNDKVDAAAIAEAMSRPDMRFVTPKTLNQQDMQSLHRVRSERIRQRTAKANQIRGLVSEYGIVAPLGISSLRRAVPMWLEDADNGLSGQFRLILDELRVELVTLDQMIANCDARIAQWTKEDAVACRLMTLRGVGPLTASALCIALGDGSAFKNGREFAASLGLVPRQHSTGGRDRLLGITKRGNGYLRQLLVHGARAVQRFAANREDGLSHWVRELSKRKHHNVVSCALANKTARAAWALVYHNQVYNPSLMAAQAG